MFTGLVETLGTISRLTSEGSGRRLEIDAEMIKEGAQLGDSVAINGACLTIVSMEKALAFQAGPETLAKTNLGKLKVGDRVNLERALRVGDRMGGHLVQGHIDGVGQISRRQKDGEWETIWFSCPVELAEQMVPKGSIAVDGISLTLVDVTSDAFSVALIPHTLAVTTLGHKQVGATVNLETDLMAKYVWKALRGSGVNWDQLKQSGFVQE